MESHPIHITDAWKIYPFWAEPPRKAIIGSTLPGVRPLFPDNELIFSRALHLSFITIWAWKSLKYFQIGHLQLHRLGVRIGYALGCCWTGRLAKRVPHGRRTFFQVPWTEYAVVFTFFSPEQGILFYCLERNVAAMSGLPYLVFFVPTIFSNAKRNESGSLEMRTFVFNKLVCLKVTSREWVSLLLPLLLLLLSPLPSRPPCGEHKENIDKKRLRRVQKLPLVLVFQKYNWYIIHTVA